MNKETSRMMLELRGGVCQVPQFQKHLMFKKTLYFIFIVNFMTIDQVGSGMTVINYFIT